MVTNWASSYSSFSRVQLIFAWDCLGVIFISKQHLMKFFVSKFNLRIGCYVQYAHSPNCETVVGALLNLRAIIASMCLSHG